MITLFALACALEPKDSTAVEPAVAHTPPYVALDSRRLARRISIDLRGRLPSPEELDTAATAEGLAELEAAWMAEPAFEAHLVDVYAEEWLLRLDTLRIGPAEFQLPADAVFDFTRAFDDEPAHLIAHVVATDKPFTDIVTTDVTMANELLTELAPVEFVNAADPGDWKEARYTDGRPANGVLASSGMWLRYSTTIFNYNRGRAAALGKLLLCYDVAARPVLFENVSDETTAGLTAAITTSPGCVACHSTMDPLASTLFGFWPYEDRDGTELVNYHPEREMLSLEATGVAPAYFGTPVTAAAQLGPLVAGDPRFATCATRRAAERLWGRPTTAADDAQVYGLQDSLTAAWSYKELLLAVLGTDEYRAGGLEDSATDADREAARPLRVLSPATVAAVFEDATGFRWTLLGVDQMESDLSGYRVLLGGTDGDTVRETMLEPTVSRSLVIRRLAQSAAGFVVDEDTALPMAERRLVGTTLTDPLTVDPASEAFEAELQSLHLRLLAEPATDEDVAAERALFSAVAAEGTAADAWAAVVSALLRDPDFWTY